MKKITVFFALISLMVFTACGSSSSSSFKVYGAHSASSVVTSNSTTYLGSPTYLLITVYSVWLGATADCTSLTLVQDYGTSGKQFNLFDSPNPTLFEGTPTDGTYNCMVLKMSDTMQFKPDTTADVCTAGTTYTYDIARGGQGWETWVDKDFAPLAYDTGVNIVYLFATTDHAQTLAKGVSIQQTINLTTPLVSPGHITMVMDFTNLVYHDIQANQCWLDKPTMAFE